MKIKTFHTQAGLSLIELMVAMAISLIIILAATTVYVAGKDGFRTTDDRNRNLESGRLALDMLTRNVRMAGAYNYDVSNPNQVLELPLPAIALGGIEGGANPDSLTVSYQSNQAYNAALLQGADCLGQVVGVGGIVTNTFSVSADGQLMCQGIGAAPARSVVGSVVDFQVLYGVLINPELITDPDTISPLVQWVPATSVINWGTVRSVELCLDIVSFEQGMTDGATPGLNCRGVAFATDNRVHRIYRTTVNVRNATRGGNLTNPSTGTPMP
jgi:type IV pilus assembly protein PilW